MYLRASLAGVAYNRGLFSRIRKVELHPQYLVIVSAAMGCQPS